MGEGPERHVVAGICQMLLRVAALAGVDRAAVLAEAGLTELDIADPDARVALAIQVRLGEAILARMPDADANLALRIPHAAVPASMGVVGYAIANCPTLDRALRELARYHRLISTGFDLAVVPDREGARLALKMAPELEALRHPVEALFVLWVAIGRQLTGVTWAPLGVRLPHAAIGDPAAYAAFFGVPVAFEAGASELQIARATLALPIPRSRSDRYSAFVAHLESMLAEQGDLGRLAGQVVARIATALPAGSIQQAEVAASLGVSARTLSRRLKAEGTTFGELVERVRRDLAIRYLRHSDSAVYEIAFLLGYSEPSTFHRVFRRWTGHTPSEFRRGGAG